MSTKNKYRMSNWWWSTLSIELKQKYKQIHESEYIKDNIKGLKKTKGTRISKLTEG